MNQLFDIPESKSPKLLWMEKHGVKTHQSDLSEDPWIAWLASNESVDGLPRNMEKCGYGNTKDEAITDLAIKNNLKFWNEE